MQNRFRIDPANPEPVDIGDAGFEVVAYSAASPQHPGHNEDAAGCWYLPSECLVVAVADGMGGGPSGGEAAGIAIGTLDRQIAAVADPGEVRGRILDSFEAANQQIIAELPAAGTTLVVAHVTRDSVRTFNVGDSGALVVGQRGKVKLETIAHSPVGYGVAAGLIDPDDALGHEDRHYVSNHLGDPGMHIALGSTRELSPFDTILLGSDGLFDNLSPGELTALVRCGPLGRAAAALVAGCAKRMNGEDPEKEGKPDDLTFVLIRRRRAS